MKSAGPNEPCPCGSGKKFKRCCGLPQAAPALDPELEAALQLHERDHRLCDELLGFANKRFGRELLAKLSNEFPGDLEENPSLLELFIPWVVYGEHVEARPLASWFLEERRRRIDADDQRWLEAQLAGHLSLWIVEKVEPGRALQLRDLFTGESRRVIERRASEDAQENLVLLGRVVDFDSISVLSGLHFQPLGPAAASEVIDAWRRASKVRKKLVPVEKLREPELACGLMDLWDAYARDMRSHGMPTLQNTDGEELLFSADLYQVLPGKRAKVLKLLSGFEGAETERLEAGVTGISFTRPGNARLKSWENTVIGHGVLGGETLRLESNSLARADRLRERVEKACEGLLEHRLREHQDPSAALSQQSQAAGPGAPQPAELLEALLAAKQRHYAGWIDEPIPALKGKTPREAAATPKGRERVDLLLRELELVEARMPEAERFEVAALRAELCL